MQRLHLVYNFGDAGLYTTCCGEQVLVVIRFNATFLPWRPYCKKMCTSSLNDAESHMVVCFDEHMVVHFDAKHMVVRFDAKHMVVDCLYSSIFFEH